MPFFRPGPGPYALALAMTGARPGEHLLHIGAGTPGLFGALAAKVAGLTGEATGVADDAVGADALKLAARKAGALVAVEVAPPSALAFTAESFDLVVLDATATPIDKAARWLAETSRVLRAGGRLIVAERTGGFRLWGVVEFGTARGGGEAVTRALQLAGFRPVRKIAERDGWRFTEGLKPRKA